MAKASPIITAFNSGEFSPLMLGRVDHDRWNNALKLCRNFLPILQGPLVRRPGTAAIAPVIDTAVKGRLHRFKFGSQQAYTIEFGDEVVRVHFNRAPVLVGDSKNISDITQANPAVVSAASHGLSNGDPVLIRNAVGMVELNNRHFRAANVTANTFELEGTDSTGYGAYVGSGIADEIFELASPYPEADLPTLTFQQSGDVLYIFHKDYPTQKLIRNDHDDWEFDEILFFEDGPYLPIPPGGGVASIDALTGGNGNTRTITIDDTLQEHINGGLGFVATDVNRVVRWGVSEADWGWLRIVGVAGPQECTAWWQRNPVEDTSPLTTELFRMGVYSETTGYPSAGEFIEDRLVLGGPVRELAASVVADYEVFSPSLPDGTVTDDSGFFFVLSTTAVNAIHWMVTDERTVVIGADASEWLLQSGQSSDPIGPLSARRRTATRYGSHGVKPAIGPRAVLFMQRGGRILREIAYVFEIDSYRAPDMTVFADHITETGIVDLALTERNKPVAWCARADGKLAAFSYERDHSLTAWSLHTLGGTAPVVESIIDMPDPDDVEDELTMIVNRDGQRMIEYLTPLLPTSDAPEDGWYLDCALQYDGDPATQINGLWHLNGTVDVLADGVYLPNQTVTNGVLTLQQAASKVLVGYGYTSEMQTLPASAGAADGTAQGKTKRIHKFVMRLWRSLAGWFGRYPDDPQMEEIVNRVPDDSWAAVPELFTGDHKEDFVPGYDRDGSIYLKQDKPYSFTVLSLMPQLVTQDAQ